MKYRYIVLGLIVLLGIFLRFYQLGTIPSSLNWDEVSWGYNAYSIAQTGRDEHGYFLPSSFRAFGDYKQPVYLYLDVLPILLWGLTGFAVRFPSALIGSITSIAVFFLVRELFFAEKRKDILSLTAAFLFAISPWSIQFSRIAFEANVGIGFTIAGVALYLYGLNRQKLWIMVMGTVVMSISCYTYLSHKLITPLLFAGLLVFSSSYLKKSKRILVVLCLVFTLANLFWIIDSRTTARGRSVLFTSAQTQILKDSAQELIADNDSHDTLGKVLHNRRLVYANTFLKNYIAHFSPNWLFILGDNPRHHPPGMGNLYLISLPFILMGMVLLFKNYRMQALFIFYWLLLAPIASALTVDSPNTTRSMVFLPIWEIFAALSIVSMYIFLRQYALHIAFVCVIGFLYFANFMYYSTWYFGHTDTEYAAYWQYGYKQAVLYSSEYQKTHNSNTIFASSFEQPYIFYLFYTKYDPQKYIDTGGSTRLMQTCFTIDHTYFGKCTNVLKNNDIFVSFEEMKDKNFSKMKEIIYPDKKPAVYIYKYYHVL
ncbi:hypothetical protein BH11PAT1_BH11PAT1_1300 [soil metagenome]